MDGREGETDQRAAADKEAKPAARFLLAWHHASLAKTYTKNRTLLFLLFNNQIVGHNSQSTTDIELRPRIIAIALSELTLTRIYLPRRSVILPSPHIEATPPTPYHNK